MTPEADFDWETSDNGVVITRYTGKETDITIPRIIQGMPVIAIGNGDDISNEAFADNKLTSVSLPDSITFVGGGAFYGNPLINITGGPQKDGFFWAKSDDGNSILITSYAGKETDIRIPSEINGMPVTAIGDDAFYGSHLSVIVIPDSVTSIGNSAFEENELVRVEIPHSVTSIGEWAFARNKLSNLFIPNSVLSIRAGAFVNNQLINVSIQNSVAYVGGRAFDSDVNVSGGSQENGFFWNASGDDKSAVITHYAGSEKNVHIPSQIGGLPVTSIGDMAFLKMGLTSVVLPPSVTLIGKDAFCFNNLTSISIPDSVRFIGENAFSKNQLASIVIPDSVTSIGDNAFSWNQLEAVTIGNSVLSIGYWAFAKNQLTDIAIPDSVRTIEAEAFAHNKLTNVSVPYSADIEEGAFDREVTITRRDK